MMTPDEIADMKDRLSLLQSKAINVIKQASMINEEIYILQRTLSMAAHPAGKASPGVLSAKKAHAAHIVNFPKKEN